MPTVFRPLVAATALLAACAPTELTEPLGALSSARHADPSPAQAFGSSVAPRAVSLSTLPTAATRFLLERAASGLLYTSESDYPFTYVFRAGPTATPLTVDGFRAAFGVAADTPVEVISLDAFFARHIERVDPADARAVALIPRYLRLRETARRLLREPRVFRVGRIAIDCYVVGTDAAGNVVGLATVAIET